MAIVNSIAIASPGFGSPAQVQQITGTALSTTGAVANTIPASGTLAQTFRTGKDSHQDLQWRRNLADYRWRF